MRCENCNTVMEVKYGSGRFCSSKCARAFSTKNKRNQINEKVSNKLKGKVTSDETKQRLKNAWSNGSYNHIERFKPKANISEVLVENSKFSGKHVKHRLIEDGLKEYKCEECGIESYNGKPITLQLHHINGKNTDQRLENLSILCPNCHSQTENFSGKNRNKNTP